MFTAHYFVDSGATHKKNPTLVIRTNIGTTYKIMEWKNFLIKNYIKFIYFPHLLLPLKLDVIIS